MASNSNPTEPQAPVPPPPPKPIQRLNIAELVRRTKEIRDLSKPGTKAPNGTKVKVFENARFIEEGLAHLLGHLSWVESEYEILSKKVAGPSTISPPLSTTDTLPSPPNPTSTTPTPLPSSPPVPSTTTPDIGQLLTSLANTMTDQIIQHLKTTTKTDDKPSNPTTPTSAQQTRSEDQRDRQNQPQLKQPSIKPTPAKQQPASNSLSVVINLAKVDQKVKERMGEFTAAQLKERTESAIAEAGVEELKDVRIRGVKMIRKNNDVVVQAFSEKQAENLLKHADTWMEIFAQNARPKRRHFKIVARAVPTSFDPKAGGAKQSLYLDNAGTIPSPSSIADVRWVNPKKALAGNGRTRSTLVLTLTNQRAADELIYRSVSVAGAICDSDQFVPDPKSCHLCHTLEHIAPACPHQNNPERWLCESLEWFEVFRS
ncbi:hypothetical protein NLI96_g11168 [Meripilus lineatus]|uniref:Uncharacterized protein n=1 Tax=Meripilus lineatus TaxID=2056292 RepID=A0AAD5YDM6_9APHY|nr:hypothetical protein NLI96_g11168 [Physisporinus lineatus]